MLEKIEGGLNANLGAGAVNDEIHSLRPSFGITEACSDLVSLWRAALDTHRVIANGQHRHAVG